MSKSEVERQTAALHVPARERERTIVITQAASDAGFRWADRASQRGVALAFCANLLLGMLAWSSTTHYFDPRVNVPAALMTLLATGWYVLQTVRGRFRRHDSTLVVAALTFVLTAMAVAPTMGPSPTGWIWTQAYAVSAVCLTVLLLPRYQVLPAVLTISLLEVVVRAPITGVRVALVEAAIPVLGACVTAWAARSATARFDQVGAALRLAAQTEEEVVEATARVEANEWWNRILHDKVLGALLMASRATTPTLLARASLLAREALETVETIENVAALVDDDAGSAGSTGSTRALAAELAELAQHHGLNPVLRVRGRDGAGRGDVVRAMLAAADQALRNVAQHSGQHAVAIRASQSNHRVRVEIRDDGVGFDDTQVGSRRMGLRSSIPGHLALVHGSAQVTSRPGKGTTVLLSWEQTSPTERGAPVSAAQLRTWWWISLLFVGLHVLGGLSGGAPLASGWTGWCGVALLTIAYVLAHLGGDGLVLYCSPGVALAASALLLHNAPHESANGWPLWFLGACHPLFVIPALRGRPYISLASGCAMCVLIVTDFAFDGTGSLVDALQLAVPFPVIPAIAALYAVMLSRADGRLRVAQEVQAGARRRLQAAQARQHLMSSRLTMLAPGTLGMLEKLAAGEPMTGDDRSASRLMEAANRDHLVAGDVLTPELATVLSSARMRGAVVHLSSTAALATGASGISLLRLAQFRLALSKLAISALDGDELTARWQPANSYAAGTVALTDRDNGDRDRFIVINGAVDSGPVLRET